MLSPRFIPFILLFSIIRYSCKLALRFSLSRRTNNLKNWQMSIINQSVTPNGHPLFHSKSSASQDASQHLPRSAPYEGTRSLRSTQPTSSLKRASLTIASGGSPQVESLHQVSSVFLENERQDGMLEGTIIDGVCNLSYLPSEEDRSNMCITHDDRSKTTVGDMVFEPVASSFWRSVLERKKFDLINDFMGPPAKPNDVLTVSVSSAVKLDGKQIDLIARKMKRLTGFRTLRLENIIDPSLIAGITISYDSDGSNVIDLSVKGQLNALAARIESSDRWLATNGHNWEFFNTTS